MHKITFGKIEKDFPENISEMTGAQYRYFCFLEMQRQLGKMEMAELEVLFVYFVLEMDHRIDAPLVVENVTQLRKLIQPYFTTEKRDQKTYIILNLDFVTNLLHVLEVEKSKLVGPGDALQNCTYEEVFVHGQNALLDFSQTREEKYLDQLVAILYRPAINGKRPIFNAEAIDEHFPLVQQLLPEIKFGVFLFFASCHKFITNANALDIGGGATVDIAQLFKPDPSQKKQKGIGSIGIIYSLAESGVFGNAKETAAYPAYDVLIRMVQLHEQYKEAKRNAKRK